ncbi:MAG: YigZ family protein [Lachnospiraceae bacterium]|nr:YigZ family protein [Lachnospiraceae bacterium]
MNKVYKTIIEPGNGEYVEKKSRFIGYVRHVESEEEAEAFITEIKKKHYDARHNCSAYSVGEESVIQRFSDDGEPSGTAGKPILEVITGNELNNVCIVVTRYFGGTLLGTGGLVRSYTEAAKECIADTEVVTKKCVIPLKLTTNYNDLGKIQYILGNEGINIRESNYGENVDVIADVFVDDIERIEKKLTEATAARVVLTRGDIEFVLC